MNVAGKSDANRPRVIDDQARVALPKEVLEVLGLQRGDYVRIKLDGKAVRFVKV